MTTPNLEQYTLHITERIEKDVKEFLAAYPKESMATALNAALTRIIITEVFKLHERIKKLENPPLVKL